MPTPTEILEDLITAYDAIYSAPSFGTVEDGDNAGDKYIAATVDTDYELRVTYRVNGDPTWSNNWTVTLTAPQDNVNNSAYIILATQDEDATDATLLAVITDYLDNLATSPAAKSEPSPTTPSSTPW